MITVIIVSFCLLCLYFIAALSYVFAMSSGYGRWVLNQMLEHPVRTSIIANIWCYGSMIVFIGTILLHFIIKYW